MSLHLCRNRLKLFAFLLITFGASVSVSGESLYVRGMAVLPSGRGHRIGELLMDNIQSFAPAQKCKRLFLSTTPFLSRAIAFYERLGFSRTGERPNDLGGTPLLTMEKASELTP